MATKRSKKRSRKRKTRRKGGAALNDSGNRKSVMSNSANSPKFEINPLPKDFEHLTMADPYFNEDNLVKIWSPIFKKGELIRLKGIVTKMITEDIIILPIQKKVNGISVGDPEVDKLWSICNIVKRYFPGYFIPRKNEMFKPETGITGRRINRDFSEYQIGLCMIMMLYGIICNRMVDSGQYYQLVFKGGRAIQMKLNKETESSDIDILVEPVNGYDPKDGYDPDIIENISGHLSLLIKWFLYVGDSVSGKEQGIRTSVLPPTNKKADPHVYKVSYIEGVGWPSFRPLSDIDFRKISYVPTFFRSIETLPIFVKEFREYALFKRHSIEEILKEKAHLYSLYNKIHKDITEGKKVEGETLKRCEYFKDKFGRAITAITDVPESDFGNLEWVNDYDYDKHHKKENQGEAQERAELDVLTDSP